MKKFLALLIIITIVFVSNDLSKDKIIIPKEAIRFRVIANSNSYEDQQLKKKVVKGLEKDLYRIINSNKDIESIRKTLRNNIGQFKENIDLTLNKYNSSTKYTIDYGMNYFPSKNYKGLIYKDGTYESLVVRLGKGEGNNFWCVLFPPLCLIDDENKNDVEYHLLVKDLLDKYF